jgi:hypothetical protein
LFSCAVVVLANHINPCVTDETKARDLIFLV